MQQLSLSFLSTSPAVDTQKGVAARRCEDHEPRAGTRSPRSQVRVPDMARTTPSSQNLVGARVVVAASGTTVASQEANYEATEPTAARANRVRKRSYRRALNRARLLGTANYRGQTIHYGPVYPDLRSAVQCKQQPKLQPRLNCVTWNCSGLSSELLLEWFVWLRTRPEIQVFALQETHWSGTREWSQEGWNLIHSAADKGRQAGLLFGVRADVASTQDATWAEVVPGRVLHWRGYVGQQQLDVVNLYQHAMSFKNEEQKQAIMQKRQQVWKAVDTTIAALPFRSSVILLGDFNASLAPSWGSVGHGVHLGSGQANILSERQTILDMLSRHRL